MRSEVTISNDAQYLAVLRQLQSYERRLANKWLGATVRKSYQDWTKVFKEKLLSYDKKVGANHRKGDWMPTYTKHRFWHLDPRPGDFHIEDIAHSLSLLCRWNGHIEQSYSVANHSIAVSYLCKKENALFGLLHDLSECYCGDLVTPMKRLVSVYRDIEDKILLEASKQFGFDINPDSETDVKHADEVMLATEVEFLVPGRVLNLAINGNKVPEPLSAMPVESYAPETVEALFLKRFYELSK